MKSAPNGRPARSPRRSWPVRCGSAARPGPPPDLQGLTGRDFRASMWAASNITDHLPCRFDHHRSGWALTTGRGGGVRTGEWRRYQAKGAGMSAIWRAGLRRWLIPGLAVLLAAAWSLVGLPAQPA